MLYKITIATLTLKFNECHNKVYLGKTFYLNGHVTVKFLWSLSRLKWRLAQVGSERLSWGYIFSHLQPPPPHSSSASWDHLIREITLLPRSLSNLSLLFSSVLLSDVTLCHIDDCNDMQNKGNRTRLQNLMGVFALFYHCRDEFISE